MKKITLKVLTFLLLIFMLVSLIPTSVKAVTNDKRIIIQKEEKDFLIYYKEICNNEFNFAFSINKEENKDNLIFISSVKDEIQEEKLNVAYINETIFERYFKDNNKAYIWVKDSEDNYKIEGEEIDLSEVDMTDDIINYINQTTKRIKGEEKNNPENAYNKVWTDDEGVKHTVILSQYNLELENGKTYYYQLVKIPKGDTTSENAKLYNLSEKLKGNISSKIEMFETQIEFYKLYQKLQPSVDNDKWIKTETGEIREPEDTITGDKYIIWLKSENGNEIIQDAKFLECYQEEKEEKEKYTPIELVKTPKTYDSKALLIIFGVIITLIVIVLILKNKSNKKEDK